MEIREAALGPDHPDVAADVAALAALVQEQGRLDEAEALYRGAAAVFEASLGPESYDLAITWNNLGALEAARGWGPRPRSTTGVRWPRRRRCSVPSTRTSR